MSYNKGDLVKFNTQYGWVIARVTEKLRYVPSLKGERIRARITTKKIKQYPFGLCYEFVPSALVLRKSKEV